MSIKIFTGYRIPLHSMSEISDKLQTKINAVIKEDGLNKTLKSALLEYDYTTLYGPRKQQEQGLPSMSWVNTVCFDQITSENSKPTTTVTKIFAYFKNQYAYLVLDTSGPLSPAVQINVYNTAVAVLDSNENAENYSYWNNQDRDSKIDIEEWEKCGEVWNEILTPDIKPWILDFEEDFPVHAEEDYVEYLDNNSTIFSIEARAEKLAVYSYLASRVIFEKEHGVPSEESQLINLRSIKSRPEVTALISSIKEQLVEHPQLLNDVSLKDFDTSKWDANKAFIRELVDNS